jgi:hypothetical protein
MDNTGLQELFDPAELFETAELADGLVDAGDVAKLTDIDAGTWQHLLNKKLVDFQGVRSGKRTLRKIRTKTIPRLVLAAQVYQSGCDAAAALRAADKIISRVAEVRRTRTLRPCETDRPFQLIGWHERTSTVTFETLADGRILSTSPAHVGRFQMPIVELRRSIKRIVELCVVLAGARAAGVDL